MGKDAHQPTYRDHETMTNQTETYKLDVEATDTFGGEANYCWVKRETIEVPAGASQALIMRRAKAALGYTGVRGRVTADFGDLLAWRPYRLLHVIFVMEHFDV